MPNTGVNMYFRARQKVEAMFSMEKCHLMKFLWMHIFLIWVVTFLLYDIYYIFNVFAFIVGTHHYLSYFSV